MSVGRAASVSSHRGTDLGPRLPTPGQMLSRSGSASPRPRTRSRRPAPDSGPARPDLRVVRHQLTDRDHHIRPPPRGPPPGRPRTPPKMAAPRSDRSMAKRLGLVYRRDRQLHVPPGLHQHATDPSQHHRPELRIPHPAHHQLDALMLVLHQHAASCASPNISTAACTTSAARREVQPHPTRVALVRQFRMIHLHHGRVPQPLRRHRRRLRTAAPHRPDHRNPGAHQQRPRSLRIQQPVLGPGRHARNADRAPRRPGCRADRSGARGSPGAPPPPRSACHRARAAPHRRRPPPGRALRPGEAGMPATRSTSAS